MLATSPSPVLKSSSQFEKAQAFAQRPQYEISKKASDQQSPINRPHSSHVYAPAAPTTCASSATDSQITRATDRSIATQTSNGRMVDAGTQYSPPANAVSPSQTPTANVARLQLNETRQTSLLPNNMPSSASASQRPESASPSASNLTSETTSLSNNAKRQAVDGPDVDSDKNDNNDDDDSDGKDARIGTEQHAPPKRLRQQDPSVRKMPIQYELCDTRDLVILISSLLMELIRYNDDLPLGDARLTRFHSRAPPGISVIDYLQRMTTHATLSPPILLSMVYYIDKLCAMYPTFTISSLTVHRFLITSATVASKGLSDSFWTNKVYAQVGGVSLKELALLELEFLGRVDWKIVPKPEVLVDYYRSLVERSDGYEIETADPPEKLKNQALSKDGG